ncbi:MAG: sulfurtransferase TusA family protein [Thermoplasmata archaeon]
MDVEGCPVPEDLLYDLEHDIWFRWDEDRRAGRIGVLSSLAAFAGKVTSVGFREVVGTVARGRSVGLIESTRYTGAVRMPVDGSVLERNVELVQRPKLVNDSTYDRGWFVRIAPVNLEGVERSLETAVQIRERLAQRIREQHVHCLPAWPDVEMFEIGAECAAILAELDQVLGTRQANDIVLLMTDDPTSPIEMVRWADRTGHTVLVHEREGNLHRFLVRKETDPHPRGPYGSEGGGRRASSD